MCTFFLSLVREDITFPRANNPIFILIPSFIVFPLAPVFLILSDPAKSTKWNFDVIYPEDPSFSMDY